MSDNYQDYLQREGEYVRASNCYVMSLVAIKIGLPLPIINLAATTGFYIANRKQSAFVKWHCMQALISQLMLFFMNTASVWWTLSIAFGNSIVTNSYIAYIITVLLFNITEYIFTIYSAVKTRKGIDVRWWLISDLADILTGKSNESSR